MKNKTIKLEDVKQEDVKEQTLPGCGHTCLKENATNYGSKCSNCGGSCTHCGSCCGGPKSS